MKKYYLGKTADFANTYDLVWADGEEMEKAVPEEYERITRAEAIRLCVQEKERQRYDPAFSGFAPTCIYPADYRAIISGPIENSRRHCLNGYIWEKI